MFKNMKLSGRIYAGFIVVLLLSVFSGVVAVFSLMGPNHGCD